MVEVGGGARLQPDRFPPRLRCFPRYIHYGAMSFESFALLSGNPSGHLLQDPLCAIAVLLVVLCRGDSVDELVAFFEPACIRWPRGRICPASWRDQPWWGEGVVENHLYGWRCTGTRAKNTPIFFRHTHLQHAHLPSSLALEYLRWDQHSKHRVEHDLEHNLDLKDIRDIIWHSLLHTSFRWNVHPFPVILASFHGALTSLARIAPRLPSGCQCGLMGDIRLAHRPWRRRIPREVGTSPPG